MIIAANIELDGIPYIVQGNVEAGQYDQGAGLWKSGDAIGVDRDIRTEVDAVSDLQFWEEEEDGTLTPVVDKGLQGILYYEYGIVVEAFLNGEHKGPANAVRIV